MRMKSKFKKSLSRACMLALAATLTFGSTVTLNANAATAVNNGKFY